MGKRNTFLNIRSLVCDNYRIVRHQQRYKNCYNFQEYQNIKLKINTHILCVVYINITVHRLHHNWLFTQNWALPKSFLQHFFSLIWNKCLVNLETSNKKDTPFIYVRNVFTSNINKFVNIKSLIGDNYWIVRYQVIIIIVLHATYNYIYYIGTLHSCRFICFFPSCIKF